MGRVSKFEMVSNFRNRHWGVQQICFCFHQNHFVNQLMRRFVRTKFDGSVEVIGRNMEHIGIIRHFANGQKMLTD